MGVTHDLLVGLAKSFGLIYLMGFFVIVAIYAYWPSLRKRFDSAAQSIMDDEDGPCQ